MNSFVRFLGICLLSVFPFFLYAQGIPSPVSFTLSEVPTEVQVGETFKITIQATIEGKWHLYSTDVPKGGPVPTTFSIKEQGIVFDGTISESEYQNVFDPNFNMNVGWHNSAATFVLPIRIEKRIDGKSLVTITVKYMVCDDSVCLPPTTKEILVPINVSGVVDGFVAQEMSGPAEKNETSVEDDTTSLLNEGVAGFIWIALTAGFAALLTPCVFPMIPLTVSYFSKQSEGSRSKAVIQSLLYGVSIIATFTILGVLLSIFLGASGASQFASNPWVNIFIGIVFLVFAVSLLGMFELQLPYTVTNYLNKKSSESSGIIGIVFMGLTISAVSFSCTAPFVGAILAATTQGAWFYPIIGMIVFSAAFASPFVIFAMFPNWLSALPKSGSWMNTVKVVLGFIELGAAFKFISNADLVWSWGLISRPLVISIWIVAAILTGIYLLGKLPIGYGSKKDSISTWSLLVSILFFTFGVYLLPGLMGASLGVWDAWLPPKQATDVSVIGSLSFTSSQSEEEGWHDSFDSAVEASKSSGKPIFIDFTGYTCTNCRAMESNVFPLTEIQNLFENYELVRLYTDDGVKGKDHQLFQFELTGTVALPTYAVVDGQTNRLVAKKSGYIGKDTFSDFLSKSLTKSE